MRITTVNHTYVGDFVIPPMRNRVSDVLNEESRLFINLTDVVINDKTQAVRGAEQEPDRIHPAALIRDQ
ncbi:MAG: hypothetical protein EXR96_06185 [Nitrospiraceae bacterium]|nr:hypothetical protein [Nitrospiraceae bacterium]